MQMIRRRRYMNSLWIVLRALWVDIQFYHLHSSSFPLCSRIMTGDPDTRGLWLLQRSRKGPGRYTRSIRQGRWANWIIDNAE